MFPPHVNFSPTKQTYLATVFSRVDNVTTPPGGGQLAMLPRTLPACIKRPKNIRYPPTSPLLPLDHGSRVSHQRPLLTLWRCHGEAPAWTQIAGFAPVRINPLAERQRHRIIETIAGAHENSSLVTREDNGSTSKRVLTNVEAPFARKTVASFTFLSLSGSFVENVKMYWLFYNYERQHNIV